MKIIVIILSIFLLVPPVQAHVDILVYETLETHIEDSSAHLDEIHQDQHHNQDSDEERETEHHHHCTMLGFSSAIVVTKFNISLFSLTEQKQLILSNKNLHGKSYLDRLFQPPRV